MLAAEAEGKGGGGEVVQRGRDRMEVGVRVEPRGTGKAVKIDSGGGDDARLDAGIDEPVRGGAEELSAREVMIDGLVEIIERGERPDDDVVVPRLEIVAADDADAERIATVGKSLGDHVGRCAPFGGPNTAPILGEVATDVASTNS